ncbi:tyrosine-type recombinase/integrase [Alkalicoccus luteus]|uniref:Site-specific integrase n=1 Tax=Alkalicoccus luteus TaxID=1237094 RepID=A0A969PN54_9BACI|nr:site-specific integrase [Alkalicoccus luteus]NJP37256.1 site-specific integrase [Alkalicoccus luteus]
MPFGYSQFLRKEGFKTVTIDEHVRYLEYFFAYVDARYKRRKELFEITPADIKDFLHSRTDSKPQTINKIISILKRFFDYAWHEGKVAVDPAQKLAYAAIEMERLASPTYEDILTMETAYLQSEEPIKRKCIFILTVAGLRPDEFAIKMDEIIVEATKVKLFISKQAHERILTFLDKRAEVLTQYINSRHGYIYLLSSTDRNGTEKPLQRMTLTINLQKISEFFQLESSLTTNTIRRAKAHYLLQSMTYEDAAAELGIDKISLMKLTAD